MPVLNPCRESRPGARFPRPQHLRRWPRAVRALAPMARAHRIFQERLAPLGCRIEYGPASEGGVFISLPAIGLSEYGASLDEAVRNVVEAAQEVARLQRGRGERWTKKLEAQHRILKKALS